MIMSRGPYNEKFLRETLQINTEEADRVCGSCLRPIDNDLIDLVGHVLPHLIPKTGEECLYGVGHEPAYIPNTPQAREKESSYHRKFRPVLAFK